MGGMKDCERSIKKTAMLGTVLVAQDYRVEETGDRRTHLRQGRRFQKKNIWIGGNDITANIEKNETGT